MMLTDLHECLRVVQKERDGILEEMAADALATADVLHRAKSDDNAWITTGGPLMLPLDDEVVRIDHGSGVSLTHEGPRIPRRAFHLRNTEMPDESIENDPTSFSVRLLLAIIRISAATERSIHTVHPATIAIMHEACGILRGIRLQDAEQITLTHPGPFGDGLVRTGIRIGKKGPQLCRPESLTLLPQSVSVRKSERDGSRYIIGPIEEILDGTTIDTLSILRSEAALRSLRNPDQ